MEPADSACCYWIFLNVTGKYIAQLLHAPVWLDSVGTGLSAYLAGPWAGMLCGGISNLIYGIIDFTAIYYTLTAMAIGFVLGYFAKKGYLKEPFGVISASFIVGIVAVVVLTPINYIIRDGRCGNIWGSALYDLLVDNHASTILSSILSEAFIDIPDKVLTMD